MKTVLITFVLKQPRTNRNLETCAQQATS